MPSCNTTPYQWCVYWLLGLSEDLRERLKIEKGPLLGYIDCLHLWLPVGLQSIQFRPPYKVRIVRRFLMLWFNDSMWICPANERQCYNVTQSLIGWAHSQNDPCILEQTRPADLPLTIFSFKVFLGVSLGLLTQTRTADLAVSLTFFPMIYDQRVTFTLGCFQASL